MAKKSIADLEQIIENKDGYQEKAIYAALLELNKRGKLSAENDIFLNDLSQKFQIKKEVEEFEYQLISKKTIYICSLLLTPLIIGPFMSYNIWRLGNKKGIQSVIGYTVLYIPLIIGVIFILPVVLVPPIHFAYAIFFVEQTWTKYIPTFEEYKRTQDS